jgi:RNA recognition motif-containing protein
MTKKLYVGNLSFTINDAELSLVFSEVGPVSSARVITDKRTGRSKGYGFVEMTNDPDADQAITQFDGGELDGRIIKVSEAKPMPVKAEIADPDRTPDAPSSESTAGGPETETATP